MDANLKKIWVKALRSGRYRQTTSWLKNEEGYCCLGVLTQVQHCKWVDGVPSLKGESISVKAETDWILPRFAGGLRRSVQKTLARMNDDEKSFKQIADYIDANL